jgi:hypothetical protein
LVLASNFWAARVVCRWVLSVAKPNTETFNVVARVQVAILGRAVLGPT